MRYPKTDDQLRAGIISAGGLNDVHELEERADRDSINDRAEYREGLETLARKYGVDRMEEIPSRSRTTVPPYGPG